MSATAQITRRLRESEPAELERLQHLYAGQPTTLSLITRELERRRKLAAQTKYRQSLLNKTP